MEQRRKRKQEDYPTTADEIESFILWRDSNDKPSASRSLGRVLFENVGQQFLLDWTASSSAMYRRCLFGGSILLQLRWARAHNLVYTFRPRWAFFSIGVCAKKQEDNTTSEKYTADVACHSFLPTDI